MASIAGFYWDYGGFFGWPGAARKVGSDGYPLFAMGARISDLLQRESRDRGRWGDQGHLALFRSS